MNSFIVYVMSIKHCRKCNSTILLLFMVWLQYYLGFWTNEQSIEWEPLTGYELFVFPYVRFITDAKEFG